MEESLNLEEFLRYYYDAMEMSPVDPGTYSPLVLAYIGDGVYELMVRSKVINRGSMQVSWLELIASACLLRSIQWQICGRSLSQ